MYSKIFKPERYKPIKTLLKEVQELDFGAVATVKGSTEDISTTRFLLYDWLFHMGLRGVYKLQLINESWLVVTKKRSPKLGVLSGMALSSSLESHMRELVVIFDKEEMETKLKELQLTQEDAQALREAWEKVMA